MDSSAHFDQIYKNCRNHWAQVDPFLLDLFTSRFPKDSGISFNFASAQQNSKILISKQIIKKDNKRVNSITSQQQIDILLPFATSRYLWIKLSTDQVKLHYQQGTQAEIGQIAIQPYISFSSTRKFSNSSFKLGLVNQFSHGFFDARFRYNIGQHRADSFYYAKYHYNNDNIKISAVGNILLKNNQINLQKNDIMAAFNIFKNNWVGVILEN